MCGHKSTGGKLWSFECLHSDVIFQRSVSRMTAMGLTMSRQGVDMFMLFPMIETLKTDQVSETSRSSDP